MNKAILLGWVEGPIELKHTNSGKAVANFKLRTEEPIINKDGETRAVREWHRIVAWGGTAESASRFLDDGLQCMIEGSVRTREWSPPTGPKRYTTEIHVSNLKLLEFKKQ